MSDQMVVLTGAEQKVFSLVDQAVKKAVKSGDAQILIDHAMLLRRQGQVSGLALSKLLYEWREVCEDLGMEKSDWADAVSAETGLSLQTIRKYSEMWQHIFTKGHPQDILSRLAGQPVQNLLLIAPAAKEDQLRTEDWERLSEAVDRTEVKEIIREIRGNKTSSGSGLIIRLTRDGVLQARRGDMEYIGVGYLNLEERQGSEIVDAAISRILRAAGIIEQ